MIRPSPILIVNIFDVWDINFTDPFSPSFGFLYILVAINYVSIWAEALATMTNDTSLWSRLWESTYFVNIGPLKHLIVMEVVIFVVILRRLYLENILWLIKWLPPITLRLVVKLRCLIMRLSLYLRERFDPIGNTSLWDCVMLYGPIVLLIRLP